MEEIQKYHLHKDDYSKLHFELIDCRPYFEKNIAPSTKPHRHSFYQLIWFKEPGRHYVDYQIVEHPENVMFFISKNQIHYFCPDSPNQGYLFHFNEFFLERFNAELMKRFAYSIFNEVGGSSVTLSDEDIADFEGYISSIKKELDLKEDFYAEKAFSFFQTILFQVERLKKKQGLFNANTDADYQIAFSFRNLIYEHMDTFLNLDEYGSLLNVNSKKLTDICKEYLGDTPANIIRELKILEAKRMLANRKVNIQEVVYRLGFDQPTYFTKYFKKATGLTPKEFQAALP